MSTEHLHRPMSDAAIEIGKRYETELNQLLMNAFDDVVALPTTDQAAQRQDAMSVAFELAAIAGAKAIAMLGQMFPGATQERIWLTGTTDLQMRMMSALHEFNEQLARRRTVQ